MLYFFFLLPFLFVFAVLWFAQWFDKRTTEKREKECNVLYDNIVVLQYHNNKIPYSYNHFLSQLRRAKGEHFGARNSLKEKIKRYKALNSFKELLEMYKARVLDEIEETERMKQECFVLFDEVVELRNLLGITPLYTNCMTQTRLRIYKGYDLYVVKNNLERVKAYLLDQIDRVQ